MQRDVVKTESWAIINNKFNRTKCWMLHLDWGNPGCMYRVGDERVENSPMERDLGVLVNSKLTMRQQHASVVRRANCTQGCIRHSTARWVKEGIVPRCPVLVWPHLQYCVWFWVPQHKKGIKLSESLCKGGLQRW